jgi:enterochelin esterase-like enzyme
VTIKELDKNNLIEADLVSTYVSEKLTGVYSKLLDRKVDVEILLPAEYKFSNKKYPLLILNDGQDNEAVCVRTTLACLTRENKIPPIIVAGVVAGDRMQEYGIAAKSDYQGRGSVAKNYSRYITSELMPYLLYQYPIEAAASNHAIAGYSLGGLSAMDIAWNHPDLFTKVGVFSGSLWWRKRDTHSRFYSDYRDRLMHQQVRRGKLKQGLKFWLQTGTQDELSDRNKNGIIDSIDDTLDLIVELTKIGYRPFHDIQYLEIKDGKHNPATWAEAMPYFLTWAFGK